MLRNTCIYDMLFTLCILTKRRFVKSAKLDGGPGGLRFLVCWRWKRGLGLRFFRKEKEDGTEYGRASCSSNGRRSASPGIQSLQSLQRFPKVYEFCQRGDLL